MDFILMMCQSDAVKLAAYGNELYRRQEPICRGIAAARDALMAVLSEKDLEELRLEITREVEEGLQELDDRRAT